jgi:hypothetical protein
MARMYISEEKGMVANRRDFTGLKEEHIYELGWSLASDIKNYNSRPFQIWLKLELDLEKHKFKIFTGQNKILENTLLEDGYIQVKKPYTVEINKEYRWTKEMTREQYL